MSTRWRHEHALDAHEAARRLLDLAQQKDVATQPDADGLGGEVAKKTPFGVARARWRSLPGAIEIELVDAPAFVPLGMVERALRDGLTRVLGASDAASS